MEEIRLCNSDYRLLMILWEHAPIGSGELVKLCNEQLGWKKSTTYTEIKRLSEKGYIKNENAVVTPLCTKEEVQAQESGAFMERTFSGSLLSETPPKNTSLKLVPVITVLISGSNASCYRSILFISCPAIRSLPCGSATPERARRKDSPASTCATTRSRCSLNRRITSSGS